MTVVSKEAVENGVYGFLDNAGAFRSNEDLRDLALAAILDRVDGRSPKDVLSEALTEEQAAEMVVDDVYQPEDNAEWALGEDGLWKGKKEGT